MSVEPAPSAAPPAEPTPIYLDHNATTPVREEVLAVVAETSRRAFANPNSRHAAGRAARRVLEDARETIADALGAGADEVIFTSGGTEATNLALRGLAGGAGDAAVLSFAGEHSATSETVAALARDGIDVQTLPLDADGRWDLAVLRDRLADTVGVRVVTGLWANNETGVVQDVASAAAVCAESGVPLHLDGVQAIGKLPPEEAAFPASGATAVSLGGHKFGGPVGIGALLLRRGTALAPLMTGGLQERELRPGTQAVALAAGFAKAVAIWKETAADGLARAATLRDRLEQGLEAACGPVVVHGRGAPRLSNTPNVVFPRLPGERSEDNTTELN
ncbi:MAG: aminotransferase class V-fold PLP-dependent enzyme [Planctomycetota bacterium]